MMATRAPVRAFLALLAVTAVGCVGVRSCDNPVATPSPTEEEAVAGTPKETTTSPDSVPPPPVQDPRPWLSTPGTTTLGFGLLRVAPAPGAGRAAFRIRFRDHGDGGYASDATSACVIALRAEPFAEGPAVFADAWLGFGLAAAEPGAGVVEAAAEFSVEGERTVVVAYGPWDGADTGRPPSNVHTFTLFVEPLDGGRWRGIHPAAGAVVTTKGARRPGGAGGAPSARPGGGEPLHVESRVLVLYDPENARSADSPADGYAAERLALPPDLFSVLEKVPIRWR